MKLFKFKVHLVHELVLRESVDVEIEAENEGAAGQWARLEALSLDLPDPSDADFDDTTVEHIEMLSEEYLDSANDNPPARCDETEDMTF